MGNCQAIDNATLVIQQPNGRVDKVYYSAVSAGEIMKLNPGHYVALLLTTTASYTSTSSNTGDSNVPLVRVTRIKLLRPSDTLVLGHVYRLVTSQEVMKGLKAKKQRQQEKGHAASKINISDYSEKTSSSLQVKQARQRSRSNTKANSSTASKGFRTWQPSLNSISETAAGT